MSQQSVVLFRYSPVLDLGKKLTEMAHLCISSDLQVHDDSRGFDTKDAPVTSLPNDL
jgi:hypothetical protein